MVGRLDLVQEVFVPNLYETYVIFVGVAAFHPSRMDHCRLASFNTAEKQEFRVGNAYASHPIGSRWKRFAANYELVGRVELDLIQRLGVGAQAETGDAD
jgi:hypothetical protein